MPHHDDQPGSERLTQALGGRPLRYYDRIGSTNDAARDWALGGAPAGAVVVADEQTSGRGRLARQWLTPPGQAIAFSVVLRPALDPARLQRVTALGGVAVCETLSSYAPREKVGMKWPNDCLIDGRKVCGILAEALWVASRFEAVVLGIGINVRVDFRGTPLADTATSLEDHAMGAVNRAELVAQVLQRVDDWWDKLADPALVAAWRGWLVTLGQQVRIQTGQGVLEGRARDVDEAGALLVIDDGGREHRVLAGDVLSGL